MKKKRLLFATICFLCVCAIGCTKEEKNVDSVKKQSNKETKVDKVKRADGTSGAWIAYWDIENVIEEVSKVSEYGDYISLFEVYFDGDENLQVPEKLDEIYGQLKNQYPDKKMYISITNDFVFNDGSQSLKDKFRLKNILTDSQKSEALCDSVIEIANRYECQGIELDFETVWKDAELVSSYVDFVRRLQQKTNLSIRVLIEPSTSTKCLKFPNNVEYGVMCYNLHYKAEAPGPKCDYAFLKKLIKTFSKTKNPMTFALATGGFDFGKTDRTSLTQEQAEALAAQYNAEVVRDDKSGSLTFTYSIDNEKHEVWYADIDTIKEWIKIVQERGNYGVWIWKLGGNRF